MSNKLSDKELLDSARKVLDREIDNLDDATLRRLREIRLDALAMAGDKKGFEFPWTRWITAGGVAMVAVIAVAGSLWISAPAKSLPVQSAEEAEILTSRDNLEMYKDLEFYRWLAESNGNGKGTAR